eukprot:GEMP01041595.1.p1 GENE.GEMP01041595.1~~GEMP01041595.1.p1  ORF type:complete len:344 (+),score=60.05 GEMP01041595.1:139-1170(+)
MSYHLQFLLLFLGVAPGEAQISCSGALGAPCSACDNAEAYTECTSVDGGEGFCAEGKCGFPACPTGFQHAICSCDGSDKTVEKCVNKWDANCEGKFCFKQAAHAKKGFITCATESIEKGGGWCLRSKNNAEWEEIHAKSKNSWRPDAQTTCGVRCKIEKIEVPVTATPKPPKPVTSTTETPKPVPVTTEAPKPVPVTTEAPKPVPVTTEVGVPVATTPVPDDEGTEAKSDEDESTDLTALWIALAILLLLCCCCGFFWCIRRKKDDAKYNEDRDNAFGATPGTTANLLQMPGSPQGRSSHSKYARTSSTQMKRTSSRKGVVESGAHKTKGKKRHKSKNRAPAE